MYYVYVMASHGKTLYIGVTSDLIRRVWQHRTGAAKGFTSRYRVNRLVYFEAHAEVRAAITREKQLKGWKRERKIALVEQQNPGWEDLAGSIGLRDLLPLSS